MQLDVALQRYEVQLAGDGRSEHTVRQVRRHVRLLTAWLAEQGHDTDVAAITHEHVARFLSSDVVRQRAGGGERKASSANTIRSSLKVFFAFAHNAAYAPSNAGRLIRPARTRPPSSRALGHDDLSRLKQVMAQARGATEVRDVAMFTVMLRCGLRLGSAIGLDVADIEFKTGEITLRTLKGGGSASVVMPDDVAILLRDQVGERVSGPVFVASHGGRVGARHARRRLEQWAVRAGIAGGVHPHQLRHSFGQALYLKTHDVVLVASAMTHRSITSSQVYVRADREALRRAIG